MASKSQKSDPYADHARPADYRVKLEIWTDGEGLSLGRLEKRLTAAVQYPGVTGVRVTIKPKQPPKRAT